MVEKICSGRKIKHDINKTQPPRQRKNYQSCTCPVQRDGIIINKERTLDWKIFTMVKNIKCDNNKQQNWQISNHKAYYKQNNIINFVEMNFGKWETFFQ